MAPSSLPTFHSFDGNSEGWKNYYKQFQCFLIANSITAEYKKKAVLLSSVGPEVFALIQTIISPKDILASNVTLQSIKEWLAELRSKAKKCGFTESRLRDFERALRDAILMGTNNVGVRQSILKKKDPSLSEIIEIAKEGEMVDRETEKLEKLSLAVHNIGNSKSQNKIERKCFSCGYSGHFRDQCKFRNARCENCKKLGHLKRICRQKVHSIQNAEETSSIEDIVTHNLKCHKVCIKNFEDCSLIFTTVVVNGHTIKFEVDTAATRSII